jgi:hypothetical protein
MRRKAHFRDTIFAPFSTPPHEGVDKKECPCYKMTQVAFGRGAANARHRAVLDGSAAAPFDG